ncbi:MAG: L-threonylcarbamoyladenylate synthase [Marmoricola sp.]
MTARFDTADEQQREDGLAAAALAIRRGELVIIPTDTVYGVACDAFDPAAVTRLLDAKGRGREMPPPVLVSAVTTLDALSTDVPEWARTLSDEFWPGPLTLVCRQQASLQWDLGDARGTVAIRMPQHDIALELIQRTGPLAVSSANLSGMTPATDADQALSMLADEVTLVLDSGATPGEQPSTIVDCTGDSPRILRQGALPLDRLRQVLADAGHPLDQGESGTDQSGIDQSGTDQPGTNQPGTNQPGTDQPKTEEPGTDQPGTDQPGTEEPGTDQPETGEPETGEPETEEPETEEPGTDQPETDQPRTRAGDVTEPKERDTGA